MVSNPTSLNPLFGYIERQIDLGRLYCETLVGLDNRNRLVPLHVSQVPSQANGGIARDGVTTSRFQDRRRSLAYDQEYVAYDPALRGFKPNMLYDYWNGGQWGCRLRSSAIKRSLIPTSAAVG